MSDVSARPHLQHKLTLLAPHRERHTHIALHDVRVFLKLLFKSNIMFADLFPVLFIPASSIVGILFALWLWHRWVISYVSLLK